MGRFYFGQIVLASISDGRGKTKDRPVLIIDRDFDNRTSETILVVCISTTPDKPIPYYHIQVHKNNKRDSHTGLSRPSWAKCNFAMWLPVKRLKSTCGHMPDDVAEQIEKMFTRLLDDDNFHDWQ